MNYTIPLELVELYDRNFHLIVNGFFDDGQQGCWIIDTGASKTVFDKNRSDLYQPVDHDENMEIQSTGIGQSMLVTTLGIINQVRFDNFIAPPMTVALIDLTHVNQVYSQATGKTICGLIGSDFLYHYQATLDYSRLNMKLRVPKKTSRRRLFLF